MFENRVSQQRNRVIRAITNTTYDPAISWKVKMSRINAYKFHFFNRIVQIWNDVPHDIIVVEKISIFKRRIYKFDEIL